MNKPTRIVSCIPSFLKFQFEEKIKYVKDRPRLLKVIEYIGYLPLNYFDVLPAWEYFFLLNLIKAALGLGKEYLRPGSFSKKNEADDQNK